MAGRLGSQTVAPRLAEATSHPRRRLAGDLPRGGPGRGRRPDHAPVGGLRGLRRNHENRSDDRARRQGVTSSSRRPTTCGSTRPSAAPLRRQRRRDRARRHGHRREPEARPRSRRPDLQEQLAERLGKSQAMVSGAESGRVRVSSRYVAAVVEACGLHLSGWPARTAKRARGPDGARRRSLAEERPRGSEGSVPSGARLPGGEQYPPHRARRSTPAWPRARRTRTHPPPPHPHVPGRVVLRRPPPGAPQVPPHAPGRGPPMHAFRAPAHPRPAVHGALLAPPRSEPLRARLDGAWEEAILRRPVRRGGQA